MHRSETPTQWLQQALAWLAAPSLLAFCTLLPSLRAQTPPPHPRLLFTSADIPGLQAKVSNPATFAGDCYSQMVTGASVQLGGSQTSYVNTRSLRRMTELAFRYQITGNLSYANNAKSMLMQLQAALNPTGTKAYLTATYPCAIALTFDWIYDQLSASERATIVARLEAWVTAMRNGSTGWGTYGSYGAAVDNFSLAWCTGISFVLMAIWGDSNYGNLTGLITGNLQKLHDGWLDAISPDGSVDESFGYANYGNLYSMNAGIAGINCGFGDYLAGTNVLKTPEWFSSARVTDEFLWTGDSSPDHKGDRFDPVIYYAVGRRNDATSLWAINNMLAAAPPGDSTPSQAWSPLVHCVLYYPDTLAPQQPTMLSRFFRDNLNQGWSQGNKTQAYPQIGSGGHAYLHNSTQSSWARMGVYYNIRDEWMNHAHEDDGHFALALGGRWQYRDQGYANQGTYIGGQTVDHNIVTVAGDAEFMGPNTNYYNPPSVTNARFLGQRETVFLTPEVDYVQGSHEFMWQMEKARRSVLMIKDPSAPYVVLIDNVRKGGGSRTYEERFVSGGPAAGLGTSADPMRTSAGGQTVRATWLSPGSVTVNSGASSTIAGNQFWRNQVTATGSEVTFISSHGATAPTSTAPLANPLSNTRGGTLQWSTASDKIVYCTDDTLGCTPGTPCMGDLQTLSDGRMAWIRTQSGNVTAWIATESTALSHLGATLLNSNLRITAAARNGRIVVQTPSGLGASNLSAQFTVSFPVTELTVDGQSTNFSQTGSQVVLGGTPLPQASNDDRCYTFTNGWLGDGVPSSNIVTTSDGGITSSAGWANLGLKNLQTVGTRPLALGMDVSFFPGAGGADAGFIIETTSGASLFDIVVGPLSSTTLAARVVRAGTILGTAVLPFDLATGSTGRVSAEYSPLNGDLRILDPQGNTVLTLALPWYTPALRVRVATTPFARIDNVTLFDSAEDGVTPQGVAFYMNPQGIGGFALRVDQLPLVQDWRPVYQGSLVSPSFGMQWILLGGIQEVIASKFLTPGAAAPATLKTAGWEFSIPVINTTPGTTTGMWFLSANSTQLLGSISF